MSPVDRFTDGLALVVGAAVASGLITWRASHPAVQWFKDKAGVFTDGNDVVGLQRLAGGTT
jgi:hypothetical protein